LFGAGGEPVPAMVRTTGDESRVLEDFQQHYGIRFNRPELLRLALTHRSYLSVTGKGPNESNERLEFLGDSVLGLVTSEHLYREHPTEHEGQLTKTKSLLVSKAILSRRALAMGLGRFVLMSHAEVESGGRQRLSILADAFESVVGAVYLDQGFEPARHFIHRWLLKDSREIAADKRHTNYKSHLQEYVQSTFHTHPVYRIRSEMGPDHSKQFLVEVVVGRRALGSGKGKNKKEAEQSAARDALDHVGTGPGERERRTRGEERPRGEERARREERGRGAESARAEREEERGRREGERPSRAEGRRRAERDQEREPRERAPEPAAAAGAAPAREARSDVEERRRRRRGGRGPRDSVEPAVTAPAQGGIVPAPRAPEPPEVEPLPPAFEEDENEEVGRPEGPYAGQHVDPYEFETSGDEPAIPPRREPSPALQTRDEPDAQEMSGLESASEMEPDEPEVPRATEESEETEEAGPAGAAGGPGPRFGRRSRRRGPGR
jgi:ribonuclease-3